MPTSDRKAASVVDDIEETDLQRRVLAHERILQVLIAQLAKGEPGIMSRLTAAFGGHRARERREHDYVDTQAYAGEFLRVVEWLVAHPALPSAEATAATDTQIGNDHTSMLPTGAIAPVIVLRVEFRRLIWAVTRDGKFYGHYHERLSALDAAVAAATAIVAQSGRADVALEYELSAADRSAHERGVNVPRSVRTVQFRPPPAVITTATN